MAISPGSVIASVRPVAVGGDGVGLSMSDAPGHAPPDPSCCSSAGLVAGVWPAERIGELDADGCLSLMVLVARERARWDAVMVRAQARFAGLRPWRRLDRHDPSDDGRGYSRFAADEIGVELGLSPTTASNQLHLAWTLTRRLPATLEALSGGLIDLARAKAVAEVTEPLDDVQAAAVEDRVLPRGRRASQARFRDALRRAVLKVDPEGSERRRRERRRQREVRTHPGEDGLSSLSAMLPAEDALAAYRRIDALARHTYPARGDGVGDGGDGDGDGVPGNPMEGAAGDGAADGRTLDERRADVFTDLLLGRSQGYPHVAVDLQVTVPWTTLAGLTEDPGYLAGYGPIAAGHVRELAEQATWRRILTDPADGSVLEVSRRRHPGPGLARHVRARDATCRFPGCNKPAVDTDLDHTVARSKDGLTSQENLSAQCRHHHRLKHHGYWRLVQTRPGDFTWTSPTGRSYHVVPEPYLPDDIPFADMPDPDESPH
jgi:Domain of unknown function (DUF222)